MARRRRKFTKGEVYFVTNRCTEGLPFVANFFMQQLLNGLIARAQELYPGVTLCHYLFMGNHYHFIVVLDGDARVMERFFGYLNGEISSAIHRLQGVAHRQFWEDRYDAKPILRANDVLEKIVYLYLNPVMANLVDRVSEWQGASSLQRFQGLDEQQYKWVSSSHLKKVPHGAFTGNVLAFCNQLLEKCNRGSRPLIVSPGAWLRCFAETSSWSEAELLQRTNEQLLKKEKEIRAARTRPVLGVKRLREQSIYRKFITKRHGRNSIAICSCSERLANYKEAYNAFCASCRKAWLRWQEGDFSVRFPPGAFIPRMYPLASSISPS